MHRVRSQIKELLSLWGLLPGPAGGVLERSCPPSVEALSPGQGSRMEKRQMLLLGSVRVSLPSRLTESWAIQPQPHYPSPPGDWGLRAPTL